MPSKQKRVVRSFSTSRRDFTYGERTIVRHFKPEIVHSHTENGLDGEVSVGRYDLEKLGWPKRIKVVIYNIDE
jgi:hypothetical protein